MFQNITKEDNDKITIKEKEELQYSLVNPGPELVIFDEGHLQFVNPIEKGQTKKLEELEEKIEGKFIVLL